MPAAGRRHRGALRRLRHDRGAASQTSSRCARNVFDVTARLREAGVFFALNHLLHFYRGQIPFDRYLRLLDDVPALEVRNGTMLRGAQRAGRASPRSGQGRRRRRSASSPAATRTRCAASARRGPRRPAARARSFWRACGRGWAVPGGAHGGDRRRSPATRTASSRRTSHRCSGSDRAICRLAARRLPGVLRGVAAGPVLAARDRRDRQVARSAGRSQRAVAHLSAATGSLAPALPAESQRMTPRVAITGIGLVTALGATREESWRRMLAGECGMRAGHGVRRRGLSQPHRRRSRHGRGRRTADAARAPPAVARRSDRPARRGRSGRPMPVCSTAASTGRASASFSAPARPICCATRTSTGPGCRRACDRTRPSDVWNHFPSTPVDAIAEQFGFEGPRACVVAACSSSTIAIGRGGRSDSRGRADAALAGGTDALSRLTFSGFNLLRLMDPAPCRPFDRSRAGMNIGEGAGILVLEHLEHAQRRGATIYAELAGHSLACEAFHPTAPEPEGRPVAAVVDARAARRAASTPTRSITSTRTARRRRRTTSPKRAGSGACSATTRPHSGDVAQVDDRPLPRRRRRGRGGGAGADRRARRHSADDSPRRDRRRLRRRRRRQRGARAAGARARCRRRSGSAATTRRSCCARSKADGADPVSAAERTRPERHAGVNLPPDVERASHHGGRHRDETGQGWIALAPPSPASVRANASSSAIVRRPGARRSGSSSISGSPSAGLQRAQTLHVDDVGAATRVVAARIQRDPRRAAAAASARAARRTGASADRSSP